MLNNLNEITEEEQFAWNAVIAGVIVSLGLQLIFNLLGVSFGFLAFDIQTENILTTSTISIVWVLLSGIIVMFIGGWITGNLTYIDTTLDNILHGLVAWGTCTVITLFFTFTTTGSMISTNLNFIAKISGSRDIFYQSMQENMPLLHQVDVSKIGVENENQHSFSDKETELVSHKQVKNLIGTLAFFTSIAFIVSSVAAMVGAAMGSKRFRRL